MSGTTMTLRGIATLAALLLGSATLPRTLCGQGPPDLNAAQREHLYYRVKPAVVLIQQIVTAEGYGKKWEQVATGSGWIISPDGYLVTNGHVVQAYHDANVPSERRKFLVAYKDWLESQEGLGRKLTRREINRLLSVESSIVVQKQIWVYLQNGKRYAAELRKYSPPMGMLPGKTSGSDEAGETRETGKDVAILKIEERNLPTVRLGDSKRVSIGTAVHVAGFPGVVLGHELLSPETIMEASFNPGQISSLKVDVPGAQLLQMTADITWGNSGGPVFNDAGDVIGMATLGSISPRSAAGNPVPIAGFNFAVPSNSVRDYVREVGPDLHPSLFDDTWKEALEAYFTGQFRSAISKFDETLRLMPGLRDAEKLRQEATEKLHNTPPPPPPPPPRARRIPWLIAAVVGLGLVLLLGGLLMRRRNAASTRTAGVAAKDSRAQGRLVVREGPLQGNQFPLTAKGVRIGRDPETCQVVLSDETVSREQAIVLASGSNSDVLIKNLSGTNPTYVNDRAVQEATLKVGDRIKIGSSVMTYESDHGDDVVLEPEAAMKRVR